jgi:flagellar protein FliO/FliZ
MLELTIRLVVSLAIVVGLLLLLARFGARKFRGQAGALVRVVHRQPLSRTTAVAVVTVGSRVLVLGTTEQQVSVLTELDPEELAIEDLVEDELDPDLPDADPVLRPSRPLLADPLEPRGPLAGSVLSAQTWRQAFQVATQAANQAATRATGRRAS